MVERILERLEELKKSDVCDDTPCHNCYREYGENECITNRQHLLVDKAKKIVQEELKNNGWTLVGEGMPPERDSIFKKFKGTERWRDGMFETTSDLVILALEDSSGKVISQYGSTSDGKWHCDLLRMNTNLKVVAWRPFPVFEK